MTKYAVELVALTGKNRVWPAMLVGPVMGQPITLNEHRIDGATIVPLECEEDRAEAIVKILQMKYAPHECYILRRGDRGGWKRMTWKREAVPA